MTSHENAIKNESALSRHNESTLPIEQAVREKAYFLYKERGGGDGSALDDWLKAESAFRVPANSQRCADTGRKGQSVKDGVHQV